MDILLPQYICCVVITIKSSPSVLGTGIDALFGLSHLILMTTLLLSLFTAKETE